MTGSGAVARGKQFAIRRVVERCKHIAQCVGHRSCTAQVVGDVVVCRPIAPVEGCPAACNGKALRGYCAALQSPPQRTRIEVVHPRLAHCTELDSLALSRPTRNSFIPDSVLVVRVNILLWGVKTPVVASSATVSHCRVTNRCQCCRVTSDLCSIT